METSTDIGKLAEALSKAQGEMKSALKTTANGAFKGSKYATLADCAEAAHPTLSKYGLAMMGGVCGTEFVARLVHSSGEWVQIRTPIPGDLTKMTIQQVIACQTYLRRASYALVGLVADEDDDGNEAAKVGTVATKVEPLTTAERSQWEATAMAGVQALQAAFSAADKATQMRLHAEANGEWWKSCKAAAMATKAAA